MQHFGHALHLGGGELDERFVAADESSEEGGHHGLLRRMERECGAARCAFGSGEALPGFVLPLPLLLTRKTVTRAQAPSALRAPRIGMPLAAQLPQRALADVIH